MSSLRTAIEYAEEPVRYQRSLFEKRKLSRQDEKEKEDEEYDRIMAMNNDTLNDTQLQLEQEKQVINANRKLDVHGSGIKSFESNIAYFLFISNSGSSSCRGAGTNFTKTTSHRRKKDARNGEDS